MSDVSIRRFPAYRPKQNASNLGLAREHPAEPIGARFVEAQVSRRAWTTLRDLSPMDAAASKSTGQLGDHVSDGPRPGSANAPAATLSCWRMASCVTAITDNLFGMCKKLLLGRYAVMFPVTVGKSVEAPDGSSGLGAPS